MFEVKKSVNICPEEAVDINHKVQIMIFFMMIFFA